MYYLTAITLSATALTYVYQHDDELHTHEEPNQVVISDPVLSMITTPATARPPVFIQKSRAT